MKAKVILTRGEIKPKFEPFKIEITFESVQEAIYLATVFQANLTIPEAIYKNGGYKQYNRHCGRNYTQPSGEIHHQIFDELEEQGFREE